MQLNQADNHIDLDGQQSEASFSSVWGNAMQREDFLALAAGLRQFNASQADVGFGNSAGLYAVDSQACA